MEALVLHLPPSERIMKMRGKGGKHVTIDAKDRVKIIALYGPPTHMSMKDLQARFHSYTLDTIRIVLLEAKVELKSEAARSGVFLSPQRRQKA